MNDFDDLSWSAVVDSGGLMEVRRKIDFKTRLLKYASNYDRSLPKAVRQDLQIWCISEKVQHLPDECTWSRSGASARESTLKREREKLIQTINNRLRRLAIKFLSYHVIYFCRIFLSCYRYINSRRFISSRQQGTHKSSRDLPKLRLKWSNFLN